MGFLSPLFLLGSLAAAIPLVLHLLKRNPELRMKFSAVQLLRSAPAEQTERQHLNRLLLLALRIAALVVLALAFARPFFSSDSAAASNNLTVVALDTSMSLSAPGRFETAQQMAGDAIRDASASDSVGVVIFADRAEQVVTPTTDRTRALSAVDRASPTFGATRYRAALDAAAEMLDGRTGTIVIVTDLQQTGWAEGDHISLPQSVRIEVADVGAPAPNLAVTNVRWADDRVVATVRNIGDQPREALVSLTADGRTAGQAIARIAPDSSADVSLLGVRGEEASVAVDDPDGVAGDNVRYAALGNQARPRVLVVTESGDLERDAFYVQHALAATGPEGPAFDVEGVAGSQLSSWDEGRFARYAMVVVLSTRGLERRGRELLAGHLKNGGGVLVAAGPALDGEVAGDALAGVISFVAPVAPETGARSLAPADARHPIFQQFGARVTALGLVKVQRFSVPRGADCLVLARFTTGEAALIECGINSEDSVPASDREGRVLAFASDLGNQWNDFPLHPMFVPFLQESVRYLTPERRLPGEYLVGEVPPGVAPTPGIATVQEPGGSGSARRVAVNVDPAESDSGRLTVAEFQAAVIRLRDVAPATERIETQQQEDSQHIWRYLLGLMFAILALESWVAARTV